MYYIPQQRTGNSGLRWGSDFLGFFHGFPDMTTLFNPLFRGIWGQNERIFRPFFLQENGERNARYLPKTRIIVDY